MHAFLFLCLIFPPMQRDKEVFQDELEDRPVKKLRRAAIEEDDDQEGVVSREEDEVNKLFDDD